jgi:hypothetical protein
MFAAQVQIQIRPARPTDAPVLGRLLAELGYPQATAELRWRIMALADTDTDAVLVAEVSQRVVGMASLHVTPFLNEGRSRARITALAILGRWLLDV